MLNMDYGKIIVLLVDRNFKYVDVFSGKEGMAMMVQISEGWFVKADISMIVF